MVDTLTISFLSSKDLLVKVVQNIPKLIEYVPSQLNFRSQVSSRLFLKKKLHSGYYIWCMLQVQSCAFKTAMIIYGKMYSHSFIFYHSDSQPLNY